MHLEKYFIVKNYCLCYMTIETYIYFKNFEVICKKSLERGLTHVIGNDPLPLNSLLLQAPFTTT